VLNKTICYIQIYLETYCNIYDITNLAEKAVALTKRDREFLQYRLLNMVNVKVTLSGRKMKLIGSFDPLVAKR